MTPFWVGKTLLNNFITLALSSSVIKFVYVRIRYPLLWSIISAKGVSLCPSSFSSSLLNRFIAVCPSSSVILDASLRVRSLKHSTFLEPENNITCSYMQFNGVNCKEHQRSLEVSDFAYAHVSEFHVLSIWGILACALSVNFQRCLRQPIVQEIFLTPSLPLSTVNSV